MRSSWLVWALNPVSGVFIRRGKFGQRRKETHGEEGHVKVKMEGVGIARKIDLSLHQSFQTLTDSLMDMFDKCTYMRVPRVHLHVPLNKDPLRIRFVRILEIHVSCFHCTSFTLLFGFGN